MKKEITPKFLTLLVLLLYSIGIVNAGIYSVEVGKSTTIYCTATAPAGYITHAFYSLVDPNDGEYIALNSQSSDLCASVVGLKAQKSVKVEVTYAYTYMGSYDKKLHVGHGTYYDYITVIGGVTPTAIRIKEGSSVEIGVGETITLNAALTPSNASTTYEWGTVTGLGNPYNFDVTYIGPTATITAKKTGCTYVVAQTANGLQTICQVTAVERNPESVSLPNEFVVYINESTNLPVTLSPANASTTYTWNIDAKDILTINQYGVVKGVKEGNTIVNCTARNGIQSNSCNICVKYREATDIVQSNDTINLSIGGMQQLNYTIYPYNAKQNIRWEILNNENHIVDVSQTGMLVALKSGRVTVLAITENDLSAPCVVNVLKDLETIKIPSYIEIGIGEEMVFVPKLYPENSYANLSWESANPEICEVSNGIINAKNKGNTTVTVTNSNGVSTSCTIYVKEYEYVNVWNKHGEKIQFLLSNEPVIAYGENNKILIKDNESQIELILADIEKITIADEYEDLKDMIDDIDGIPANNNIQRYYIEGRNIIIKNIYPNSYVKVYDINGKMIQSDFVNKNAAFTFRAQKAGMYIVKTSTNSFKVVVK